MDPCRYLPRGPTLRVMLDMRTAMARHTRALALFVGAVFALAIVAEAFL